MNRWLCWCGIFGSCFALQAARADSSGNASTNAAPAAPSGGSTMFGTVTISSQPTAEITTLNTDLMAHIAQAIALDIKPNIPSNSFLISTQPRSALIDPQFDNFILNFQNTLDQSSALAKQFNLASAAFQSADISANFLHLMKLLSGSQQQAVVAALKAKGYPQFAQSINKAGGGAAAAAGILPPPLDEIDIPTEVVQTLTGFVQSVGSFVSLFRSNETISGQSIPINNEPLTFMVATFAKQSNSTIKCYLPSFLPIASTKVLGEVMQLKANSAHAQTDAGRITLTPPMVAAPADGTPVYMPTKRDRDQIFNLMSSFVAQLNSPSAAPPPAAPAPAAGSLPAAEQTGLTKASTAFLTTLQKSLNTYNTDVTSLLSSLNGPLTGANSNAGNQSKGSPGSASQPASPSSTSTTTTTTTTTTTATTAGTPAEITPSSAAPQDASKLSSGSPSGSSTLLDVILQDEALSSLLHNAPLLYLNIIYQGGSNETVNGLFTSSVRFRDGIVVDYALLDTDGSVIVSGTEARLSPYLKTVGHSDEERVPTVVTETKGRTTSKDIQDVDDDTEPRDRFSVQSTQRVPAHN